MSGPDKPRFSCSRCGAPIEGPAQVINVWRGPFGRVADEHSRLCRPCTEGLVLWFSSGKIKVDQGGKLT